MINKIKMKKFLLSLSLVAMLLPFSSCGDDEPYAPVITNETIMAQNVISSTIIIESGAVNYIEKANYTFNIEYRDMREATIKVVANGVKFDSHMPFGVSFEMEEMKTNELNDYYVKFHSSKVKFLKPGTDEENTNYTLTDVNGYIDKANGVYSLEYTVNGKWHVIVCSSSISSRVEGNDYRAPSQLYYNYKIDVATMKAEVFIYNVQFTVGGATSPVLKKISIPNLDVTATATGFELTGTDIVPTYYTGENLDQGTPYPALVVTNYKSTISVPDAKHTIYFNARGGEHSNTSDLYLWSWKAAQ